MIGNNLQLTNDKITCNGISCQWSAWTIECNKQLFY